MGLTLIVFRLDIARCEYLVYVTVLRILVLNSF